MLVLVEGDANDELLMLFALEAIVFVMLDERGCRTAPASIVYVHEYYAVAVTVFYYLFVTHGGIKTARLVLL